MCRLLIFERVAPWRGCGCIECSSSAFRKLGTLSRRDDLTKPLFTASLLPSGSLNKWKKKEERKKNILGPRVVAVCSTGYSRPPRSQFRNSMRETRVPREPRCSQISRFIGLESIFLSLFFHFVCHCCNFLQMLFDISFPLSSRCVKGLLAKCRKNIQYEFDLSLIQFNFNQVFFWFLCVF